MAVDLDSGFDDQDQSEVFDEDNTNPTERGPGEEAEQLEDLDDVFDVTSAVGDADEDEGEIAEDLDDAEIVARARDQDEDDDDLEDDDLRRRDEIEFADEEGLDDMADVDELDLDEVDAVAGREADEVELEYAGDLNDRAGARSAAQSVEADTLSDADLRELDYKDEFTVDEDDDARPE